jgi:FMN phosphatase YigB (HAD superfamily)
MFFCKKCSTEKPETEWYYSVRGRDSMCKSCRKEYRKDIKRGYQKTYYQKNKEYYQNLNKEFFDNNPEYHKKWNRRKPENRLLMSARKRAKEKGLEFNLEIIDIVIPSFCPVLKVPMIIGTNTAPSIDRIDSTKGYVKGNIKIISKRANTIKSDGTVEEHKAIIQYMIEHLLS